LGRRTKEDRAHDSKDKVKDETSLGGVMGALTRFWQLACAKMLQEDTRWEKSCSGLASESRSSWPAIRRTGTIFKPRETNFALNPG